MQCKKITVRPGFLVQLGVLLLNIQLAFLIDALCAYQMFQHPSMSVLNSNIHKIITTYSRKPGGNNPFCSTS